MQFGVLGPVEVRRDGSRASARRAEAAGAPGDPAPARQRGRYPATGCQMACGASGRPRAWSTRWTTTSRASARRSARAGSSAARPATCCGSSLVSSTSTGSSSSSAKGATRLLAAMRADASRALQAALALWRGLALADVLDEPFARAESGRLEGRRLRALEERIEADLARGAAAELMPELEELVDRNRSASGRSAS